MASSSSHILMIGAGYTAQFLAQRLRPLGWQISGTTRSADKTEALRTAGITPIIWPSDERQVNDEHLLNNVDALLISTPPQGQSCPVLTRLGEQIKNKAGQLRWIGYLSSNSVYGNHDGAWVDEDAALHPSTDRARNRIRAEADWTMLGVEYSLPVITFRLPGIYGPGRSAFDKLRAGTAQRLYKKDQVFNRAHVEDIAAILHASLDNPHAGDLFNICDDEPSPPQDVVEEAAQLLGLAPPPLIPLEEAQLSAMARSFYTDNKRVSNKHAKEALEITLQYPTYREGLRAILAQENRANA